MLAHPDAKIIVIYDDNEPINKISYVSTNLTIQEIALILRQSGDAQNEN